MRAVNLSPRRMVGVAGAYLVLLSASHVVDGVTPENPLPPGMRTVPVHIVDHGEIRAAQIGLAYRDTDPASTQVPVLLIHGSPGSGEVMRKLSELLAPKFRVIVPDLPGFGASARALPDYSLRAHGEYLIELLDALHIPRARLVGFSMGGGVALSMADLAPQRVSAIVMLSALGVQEHELTGSYAVNHAIHGIQLAGLWLLRNGLPHFGLFRRLPLSIEYARNFYDSDQRPLRGVLEQYRGPILIIHGLRDRNVPIAAAREHHRLARQSELVELDDNHFMTFLHPRVFIDVLVRFLQRGARL